MLARLSSLQLVRLICAALLAAIALHAGEPVDSVERNRGSAFSAATYDVAVSPAKVVLAAPAGLASLPPPLLVRATPGIATQRPAALWLRPDSTGPPARAEVREPFAPRDPPRA